MAYSIQTAVSDGNLEVLDLSIKYMDKSHIFVYVDDVLVDGSAYSYVWLTDTRIQLVPKVANGSTLKVIRKTLTDEMWHEFSKGARFSTSSMDDNFEQLLFLAQEYSEGIYISDFYSDVDLHLKRILNLGDPINDGDAVNLKTLKEYLPNADLLPPILSRLAAEEAKSAQLVTQGLTVGNKVIIGFDGTSLEHNAWVSFAGRDTVGDGGGGQLRFLAGSTATANGITIYAVTGGRLVREGWSVFGIDARWAGADATGTEDSATEIQAALNLGGEVRLPGKFRYTSTLYITKPGTSLVGRGWASVIGSTSVQEGSDQLIYEGAGYAISVAPSGASDIERVRLKGFAITGNGTNDGVYVENCRHSEFNNVYITNVRDCWYFNDTDWQNKMTRCQGMSFSRYGIYANSGTEDSVLDTCIFRGYGSASVGLYVNYYASTLTAVNCDFSDNKTNVVLNLGLSSVDGVFKFQGCQFEGGTGGGSANHVGVQLLNSSEGTVVIFEGCRWTHTDAANRASAKAILANAAKSLVVRGARVTNIGTFIDIPTASSIGRLEVKDVIGSGVTTAFANQANSVSNREINNVLSEPNNDSVYSEGTFTPAIVGTSTSGVGTYTTQLGYWRRVGNVVYFNAQCTWTAHTGTGNLQINGLPFVAAAIGTAQPVSVFMSDITLSANNTMQCFIGSGVSSIAIRQVPIGGGVSAVVPMDTAGTVAVSGNYFV